jgi:hypothetical protein
MSVPVATGRLTTSLLSQDFGELAAREIHL